MSRPTTAPAVAALEAAGWGVVGKTNLAGKQPVVYSTPVVAWRPVVAATAYEIQWSRGRHPWRARGSSLTYSTSSVLKLGPGLWYYRIRGLNAAQVGTPAMTWSAPITVRVVRPTFQIAGG